MTKLGSTDFWKKLKDDPTHLAAEVCTIDMVNLDETLQRHSALRAWINAAHEVARISEERLKWELTKARAVALLKAKAEPDPDNPGDTPKAKTVGVLEAEVETNTIVEKAKGTLLQQQEKRGVLRAMTDALKDRTDMLVQLSARQREEMKDR